MRLNVVQNMIGSQYDDLKDHKISFVPICWLSTESHGRPIDDLWSNANYLSHGCLLGKV